MDEPGTIYPRALRTALETALADTPVVCLLGPRQCGKSTLARTFAPQSVAITLDDSALLATARSDPDGFVGALPASVIIDEIQRAPELLRAIKASVDRDRRPGRFLLTGSANLLLLPQISESLAGRSEVIQLHPLTEAEKNRRPGQFLTTLIGGRFAPEIRQDIRENTPTLPDRLVAGGYPEPLTRSPARARQWHRQYLRTLIERDVQDIARVRDVSAISRLLETLALRNAELLNISNLGNELDLRRETIEHYLSILERLFLIRRLPAWHRNEAKRLVKTPKIHLLDSGLAATLSGLTTADWLPRRAHFGHLLEAFVVQQIVAQAGWTNPELRFWHYRDKDQVEVDVVITQGRKTWGIEVKSAASVDASDARGLRQLAAQAGADFQGGVLLYAGVQVLPLGDPRFCAVPLNRLWTI